MSRKKRRDWEEDMNEDEKNKVKYADEDGAVLPVVERRGNRCTELSHVVTKIFLENEKEKVEIGDLLGGRSKGIVT